MLSYSLLENKTNICKLTLNKEYTYNQCLLLQLLCPLCFEIGTPKEKLKTIHKLRLSYAFPSSASIAG